MLPRLFLCIYGKSRNFAAQNKPLTMNDYYALRLDVEPCSADATDLLAYLLGEAGYESFVPDDKGLTAYVPAALYSDDAVRAALQEFAFDATVTASAEFVEGRDWNAEWERNYFKPIVVGERCVVHSSFHTDVPAAEFDIVIDPKMAFGTGHHATTSLILGRLLDMPLQGRSLIDVGTGTGILAILAAMRGAVPVAGIEIDRFAWENACDNVRLNSRPEIAVLCGDASCSRPCNPPTWSWPTSTATSSSPTSAPTPQPCAPAQRSCSAASTRPTATWSRTPPAPSASAPPRAPCATPGPASSCTSKLLRTRPHPHTTRHHTRPL